MKKVFLMAAAVLLVTALAGMYKFNYLSSQPSHDVDGNRVSTQLSNPASQACIAAGGLLELETTPQGQGQVSMCVFPSGERCEEWALFRGTCQAPNAATPAIPTETYTGAVDGVAWTFEQTGYSRFRLKRGEHTEEGEMNSERGWQNDENATVYVLHSNAEPERQRVFVRRSGLQMLELLDSQRALAQPPLTLQLKP
jgi:putative hemolysin